MRVQLQVGEHEARQRVDRQAEGGERDLQLVVGRQRDQEAAGGDMWCAETAATTTLSTTTAAAAIIAIGL